MMRHIPLLTLRSGCRLVLWRMRRGGVWLVLEWPGPVKAPPLFGGPGWRSVRGVHRRVLWGIRGRRRGLPQAR